MDVAETHEPDRSLRLGESDNSALQAAAMYLSDVRLFERLCVRSSDDILNGGDDKNTIQYDSPLAILMGRIDSHVTENHLQNTTFTQSRSVQVEMLRCLIARVREDGSGVTLVGAQGPRPPKDVLDVLEALNGMIQQDYMQRLVEQARGAKQRVLSYRARLTAALASALGGSEAGHLLPPLLAIVVTCVGDFRSLVGPPDSPGNHPFAFAQAKPT
jgi:hypothetical protein